MNPLVILIALLGCIFGLAVVAALVSIVVKGFREGSRTLPRPSPTRVGLGDHRPPNISQPSAVKERVSVDRALCRPSSGRRRSLAALRRGAGRQ